MPLDSYQPSQRPPAQPPLASERIATGRKVFFLDLKENDRGRLLKITEDVGGRRDTIIVPAEAARETGRVHPAPGRLQRGHPVTRTPLQRKTPMRRNGKRETARKKANPFEGQAAFEKRLIAAAAQIKKTRKPLRPVSKKRATQNVEYGKLRKAFMAERPKCEAAMGGICTGRATHVHHKAGRCGKMLNAVAYWLAVCPQCHDFIHSNGKFSRENGLLLD